MKLKTFLFKSVTSTNDIAINKIKQGIISGIIFAKKQTKGRGRYGNKWISMNNNLFMSIFFNLNSKVSFKKLTYNTCAIVQKSLIKFLNKKIQIKRPNDLLINKKRYVEFYGNDIFNDKKFVIIGIGINIDRSPDITKYPTTYINLHLKKKITSFKIYNEIKNKFENFLKK